MILAPLDRAFRITSGFRVSTEINLSFLDNSLITGITLFCSSNGLILLAPGLVDSPPTSIIEAPSLTSIFACLIAFSVSKN